MAALLGDGQVGVLEHLVGEFQEHTLLGVHLLGFARGDGEEFGVEVADVLGLNVAAAGGGYVDLGLNVLVLQEFLVAVGGTVGDGIDAVVKKCPVLLGGVSVAGEAGGHTDDGDVGAFDGGAVAYLLVGFGGGVGVVEEEDCQFVHRGVLVHHGGIDRFTGEIFQLAGEFQNASGG